MPVGIKDVTPTRGKTTTRGSKMYERWVPDYDALIVKRLAGAGAIMVGKTTSPEFAYDSRATVRTTLIPPAKGRKKGRRSK